MNNLQNELTRLKTNLEATIERHKIRFEGPATEAPGAYGLRQSIRQIERLSAAPSGLVAAQKSLAQAEAIQVKTGKSRVKLEAELQSALADQVVANALLEVANQELTKARAAAYRGKPVDPIPFETTATNAVTSVVVLDAAIASIENEIAALPPSTVKAAKQALLEAEALVKSAIQWGLDRTAALAVRAAAENNGEAWPVTHAQSYEFVEHLTEIYTRPERKTVEPIAECPRVLPAANSDKQIEPDSLDA